MSSPSRIGSPRKAQPPCSVGMTMRRQGVRVDATDGADSL
jgi:hypothetical protein